MRYLGVTKTYTDSYKKRDFEMEIGAKLSLAGNVSGHLTASNLLHFGKTSQWSASSKAERESARDGHVWLNNSGVRRKRKEQVV